MTILPLWSWWSLVALVDTCAGARPSRLPTEFRSRDDSPLYDARLLRHDTRCSGFHPSSVFKARSESDLSEHLLPEWRRPLPLPGPEPEQTPEAASTSAARQTSLAQELVTHDDDCELLQNWLLENLDRFAAERAARRRSNQHADSPATGFLTRENSAHTTSTQALSSALDDLDLEEPAVVTPDPPAQQTSDEKRGTGASPPDAMSRSDNSPVVVLEIGGIPCGPPTPDDLHRSMLFSPCLPLRHVRTGLSRKWGRGKDDVVVDNAKLLDEILGVDTQKTSPRTRAAPLHQTTFFNSSPAAGRSRWSAIGELRRQVSFIYLRDMVCDCTRRYEAASKLNIFANKPKAPPTSCGGFAISPQGARDLLRSLLELVGRADELCAGDTSRSTSSSHLPNSAESSPAEASDEFSPEDGELVMSTPPHPPTATCRHAPGALEESWRVYNSCRAVPRSGVEVDSPSWFGAGEGRTWRDSCSCVEHQSRLPLLPKKFYSLNSKCISSTLGSGRGSPCSMSSSTVCSTPGSHCSGSATNPASRAESDEHESEDRWSRDREEHEEQSRIVVRNPQPLLPFAAILVPAGQKNSPLMRFLRNEIATCENLEMDEASNNQNHVLTLAISPRRVRKKKSYE